MERAATCERICKAFFHCARKILHEQERSTCLEAAAKGKSANFLSQYLTFQSVLARTLIQKNTRNKELCCLRSFPAGNVPNSSSPGTETGPRFWLSSSKVQAHAIRGPKLELRLGSHFWGPIMPFLLEQKPHLLTQLVVVFKSKQNLAQLCSAASCRCSFKT